MVKSAGPCRSKVEMGKGNDGLEGKLKQHAASQLWGEREGEEERLPRDRWLAETQTCPTVVIHLIHMSLKRLLVNEEERIQQWHLLLTLILIIALASTGDSPRENTTRCLQPLCSGRTKADLYKCSGQHVSHIASLHISCMYFICCESVVINGSLYSDVFFWIQDTWIQLFIYMYIYISLRLILFCWKCACAMQCMHAGNVLPNSINGSNIGWLKPTLLEKHFPLCHNSEPGVLFLRLGHDLRPSVDKQGLAANRQGLVWE